MALPCLWRQFHLQQLQRMSCSVSRTTQQPGPSSQQHHMRLCKMACDHTAGSLITQPSERNNQCHVHCLHPKRFRTSSTQTRKQLILSRSFSSYGNPTFGMGGGWIPRSNITRWGHGLNTTHLWTGVHDSWMGKLLARENSNGLMADSVAANSLLLNTTTFDRQGNHVDEVIRKSELLQRYGIQARDIRFSTFSSLYVRSSSIVVKLQHIKAIIKSDSLVLLDSDHPAIQEFIAELEERLKSSIDVTLPFEFRALETMLMKIFTVLDHRLNEIQPALREVLNGLLDPRLFSVDRGELHILLHQSKNLSEFHSVVKDIESTLDDVLEYEEDLAEMYLTHWATTGAYREEDDIEDLYNILETYHMQTENILSEIQKLRELIDQSESIILINLDSQRNIMLRLSLQLEMGMFSAAISGLIGMAFGMNLNSSLEENPYAFWVLTGFMITSCGLLWRRLLTFVGKNLERPRLKKLTRPRKD